MSLGLSIVRGLVDLVTDGILGGGQAIKAVSGLHYRYIGSRNICFDLPRANADIVVLGNLLVSLLASTRDSALNGLRDVVESLLGGLHCEVLW